jgi:hypothetical protein
MTKNIATNSQGVINNSIYCLLKFRQNIAQIPICFEISDNFFFVRQNLGALHDKNVDQKIYFLNLFLS